MTSWRTWALIPPYETTPGCVTVESYRYCVQRLSNKAIKVPQANHPSSPSPAIVSVRVELPGCEAKFITVTVCPTQTRFEVRAVRFQKGLSVYVLPGRMPHLQGIPFQESTLMGKPSFTLGVLSLSFLLYNFAHHQGDETVAYPVHMHEIDLGQDEHVPICPAEHRPFHLQTSSHRQLNYCWLHPHLATVDLPGVKGHDIQLWTYQDCFYIDTRRDVGPYISGRISMHPTSVFPIHTARASWSREKGLLSIQLLQPGLGGNHVMDVADMDALRYPE